MTDVTGTLTIEQLERGEIEAGAFDHEAHVYMGWLYLDEYAPTEAIARFRAALQRLVVKLGAQDKYHDTITWFYMLVIAERRQLPGGAEWSTFRHGNPDLFDRQNNVLQRYYSKELLASDEARSGFVLPDRIAA